MERILPLVLLPLPALPSPPGLRRPGGGGDHAAGAGFAGGDEVGDEAGLGQVRPELARHLRLHGADLEAGGIEDAAVVGAPEFVVGVLGRHVLAAQAGQKLQPRAVPARRFHRRADAPVHVGETTLEKRRGQADDAMLRFIPGDELLAPGRRIGAEQAEAHEGMHLVDVAPYRLRPSLALAGVGIGGMIEQMFFATASESEEQPVQHGKPTRIGVRAHRGGERQKRGRHRHGWSHLIRRRGLGE